MAGLINETNRQYYEGAKSIIVTSATNTFSFEFNTPLVWYTSDVNNINYISNNFKLYFSSDNGLSFIDYDYQIQNVVVNTVYLNVTLTPGQVILVQLKTLEGGNYGNDDAFGTVVEENYGSYAYITLDDIINNFLIAYVGTDKLIGSIKRTDVIFHAKRSMQEFSYDVLKSIKSQELTIPPSLNVIIPQDYVNYVKISRIDLNGVKHVIYPGMSSGIPYTSPVQDTIGQPIQDELENNINATSITEERFKTSTVQDSLERISLDLDSVNDSNISRNLGQRYGMNTSLANVNGVFMINEREGKISFSSNLVDCVILLEYISDGLAYDLDTRIPKLAEEAIYSSILYAILSTRSNQPEHVIQRLKQEKFAKIRNTKIRLSNIKIEEFTKVLRGQYKWIKN